MKMNQIGIVIATILSTALLAEEKPPVWITFLPCSPIRSLASYHHSHDMELLESENPVIQSCELEMRLAKDHRRIARFTFDYYPFKKERRRGCHL